MLSKCSLSPVTLKFYIKHSITEVSRHKCNSCLGIFSIFCVVVISALCYTLVENAPVVFFRQSEQIYGQYDVRIKPRYSPLLNYTLIDSLLSSTSIYSSPRILWNETNATLFSHTCFTSYTTAHQSNEYQYVYDTNDGCTVNLSCNDSYPSAQIWLIDFENEEEMGYEMIACVCNTSVYICMHENIVLAGVLIPHAFQPQMKSFFTQK